MTKKSKKDKGRTRRIRVLIGLVIVVMFSCCVILLALPPVEESVEATLIPETATAAAIAAMNETATQAALPTATLTDTPIPTATPTITNTPIPTLTYTPLPPEIVIQQALRLQDDEVIRIVVNAQVVTVRWYLTDVAVSFARNEAGRLPVEFSCTLRGMGYVNQTYQLTGIIRTVDTLGNEGEAEGVEVIIPPTMHSQINCDNQAAVNLGQAVRGFDDARYDLSPLLNP